MDNITIDNEIYFDDYSVSIDGSVLTNDYDESEFEYYNTLNANNTVETDVLFE